VRDGTSEIGWRVTGGRFRCDFCVQVEITTTKGTGTMTTILTYLITTCLLGMGTMTFPNHPNLHICNVGIWAK
jgi:hypothetical protein